MRRLSSISGTNLGLPVSIIANNKVRVRNETLANKIVINKIVIFVCI